MMRERERERVRLCPRGAENKKPERNVNKKQNSINSEKGLVYTAVKRRRSR